MTHLYNDQKFRDSAYKQKVNYYIVARGTKWSVKFNNKHYGAFGNKNDAIRSAMDAAKGSIERGFDANVMIVERDSEWKLEWNNKGDDLFPFGKRHYKEAPMAAYLTCHIGSMAA